MQDVCQYAAQALEKPGKVVFLTGAGISAESGIPTFRGKEGFWTVGSKNYLPEELATNAAFRQMPDELWGWYLYRRTICRRAQPNAAHEALVAAEDTLNDRFLLITQNVDGLHTRAGNSLQRTYQIHGNIDFMRCTAQCEDSVLPIPQDMDGIDRDEILSPEHKQYLICPRCSSATRPHVLWFDEMYDEENFRFNSSLEAARNCALLVIIGTSGATNLPNQIAQNAAAFGAAMIDINPEENLFSRIAVKAGGRFVAESAGEAVPRLVGALSEI